MADDSRNGKGSAPRPVVDRSKFDRNWGRIKWGEAGKRRDLKGGRKGAVR